MPSARRFPPPHRVRPSALAHGRPVPGGWRAFGAEGLCSVDPLRCGVQAHG